MPQEPEGDDEMTTGEVAELLEVSESTVRRYGDAGYLGAVRQLPTRHRRFSRQAVLELARVIAAGGHPDVPPDSP